MAWAEPYVFHATLACALLTRPLMLIRTALVTGDRAAVHRAREGMEEFELVADARDAEANLAAQAAVTTSLVDPHLDFVGNELDVLVVGGRHA